MALDDPQCCVTVSLHSIMTVQWFMCVLFALSLWHSVSILYCTTAECGLEAEQIIIPCLVQLDEKLYTLQCQSLLRELLAKIFLSRGILV